MSLNIQVGVISKNQLEETYQVVSKLICWGYTVSIYLTAPTVDEKLATLPVTIYSNSKVESGFFAGRARNALVSKMLQKTPELDLLVLFDGDRCPQTDPYDKLLEAVITYDCGIFPLPGVTACDKLITSNKLFNRQQMFFPTAGFYLTRKALETTMTSQIGALCHTAFDGLWGMEDHYLGQVLLKHKFDCCVLPESCSLSGGIQCTEVKTSGLKYTIPIYRQLVDQLYIKNKLNTCISK